MAKQMRCNVHGSFDARQGEGPAHDMANAGGTCKWNPRRVRTQENPLHWAQASIQTQILNNRGSDIAWQRKKVLSAAFASDQHLTCPPVDVSQFEEDDFAGSKSQFRQQDQDRIISATGCSGPIWSIQHSLNFLGGEFFRDAGLGPSANSWNRRGEIVTDLTLHVGETQKGTQARGQQTDILAGSILRTLEQKSTQNTAVEAAQRGDAVPLLKIMEQLGN
jgi:hypothetical protein